MKQYKVAILGCGARGLETYAQFMSEHGGFVIHAACDVRQARLDKAVDLYGVKKENCFLDENEFLKEKRGDIIVISTQDQDHVRQAIKALDLGYDVLLEKPISPSKEECLSLLEAKKRTGRKVVVCHVLRYAPAYTKVSELIDGGQIGELIDIHAIEQVAYWHIAHSFVRGNWRRKEETSPMILAKCCHDMDLLQFYAKSKAKTVSSIGSLAYFNKEHMPKDATKRCTDCPHYETCPYSAKRIYVERWKLAGKPDDMWPQNVTCIDYPLTEEKIINAYSHNEYGRCVFACDNDVVDHQEANILFENGVTANLCMMGFTSHPGRIYRFHGTLGEIVLDEETRVVTLKRFGEEDVAFPFSQLIKRELGHGGGDIALIDAFYQALEGNETLATSLDASIESHLMAFAAEESRLHEGKAVDPHKI